ERKKREEAAEVQASQQVASISDKWRLVDLFLEYKGLVTQHIDSYNHFVNVTMKKIVKAASNNTVRSESDVNWFLQYESIRVGRPSKTEDMIVQETNPHMCRLRDLTYAAPIYVDVVYWKGDRKVRKRDLEIGMLPVMLRSNLCPLSLAKTDEDVIALGECPLDPGGYFIVKGVERVLMMQEQSLMNRIVVEYDSKKLLQAFVTSSSEDTKSRTVVVANPLARKKGLYMKNSAFADLIPISIVMKAMGAQSDMEIIQMVGIQRKYLDTLMISLQECHEKNVFSQKSALDFLSTKIKIKPGQERRKQDPMDIIKRQVLSHIECPNNNLAPKIRYFGLMIRRVINAMYDGRLVDDRDYYGNKRLELSGQLIEVLFEDQFKFMNMELQKQADLLLSKWHQSSAARVKDMSSYPDILDSWQDRSKLTRAMANAISTGNWNIKRFRIDRAGVSQVLSRFSYMSCVGSMMRVKSQFEKSRKVAGPRALQPSQWGMICPADTPEGEQCGLVKHLALLTHVTTGESQRGSLRQMCYCLGVEDALMMSGEELHHIGNYLVFLNGSLLGIHRRPKRFMASLQQLRRRGLIGEFVSIYEDEGWHAIFVASDGGRLCRPLIIVADCKPRFIPEKHVPLMLKSKADGGMKFEDFLKQGVVEWVDVNEENNLFIALHPDEITPETTHLEIEPFTLLGVVSGLIPYPNHNQSPRNTYECAMGKQAMGCIAMNQFTRSDTLLLGLVYPEKPLCTSKTLNLVNFHHLGAGQNASVAVMSYSGYDIEDAIIMNRAALDRGFGRCFVMRRQGVQMAAHGNGTTDLLAPPMEKHGKVGQKKGRNAKLAVLDEDGMVRPSEKVEDGFLLANKISPVETKALHDLSTVDIKYKATPVNYKNPVSSYIDRVLLTTDAEGMKVYKIITRQTRRPEVGDKFASRHGQKGVIGLIVPEQDLPFSETGWRPDLIMNPHGFPSRMTVGKMLECIGSKAAVLEGMFANGSAFGGTPAQEIYRTLISHGFAPTGKEYLTSGITGEPIESYIFCGPIYYQKLKHMVVDKMHARARGPRMLLTRQPTEGRAKEGGLRLGEMERDCLVAYGASNLLLERLMLSSDVCNPNVCRKCGLFCRPDWCKLCSSAEWVTNIRLPYACKLLFQEMQAMNVTCKLSLAER
ncbi:rpc2, partial [Symbiodinium sp. KB8]